MSDDGKTMFTTDRSKRIGWGNFSDVFQARTKDGRKCAVKYTQLEDDGSGGIPACVVREVCALERLGSHPHIVPCLDLLYHDDHVEMLMPRYKMSLRAFLDDCTNDVGLRKRRVIMKGILSALAHTESKQIIHRDLKPSNILVQSTDCTELAVCDFGLARPSNLCPGRRDTDLMVTSWYRAPEVLWGVRHHTHAVDVWSAGCILFELITGNAMVPFHHHQLSREIALCSERITEIFGVPDEKQWPGVTSLPNFKKWCATGMTPDKAPSGLEAEMTKFLNPGILFNTDEIDLLRSMLQLNPSARITATDALGHSFFQ